MAGHAPPRLLRDLLAWAVVLLFMFPLAWWVLASFKPYTAIFNTDAGLCRLRRRPRPTTR